MSVSDVPTIRTPRFELVSMSLAFMRLLLARDLVAAAAAIGAAVPPAFADRLDAFLQFRIADLSNDPVIQPWLGRAIVQEGPAGRQVIGSVGFHAPPDEAGWVEIGYHVEPALQRHGVATEAASAMLDWARREHGVRHVRACTAPDNVASRAVLARLGFREVGSAINDLGGIQLIFERDD